MRPNSINPYESANHEEASEIKRRGLQFPIAVVLYVLMGWLASGVGLAAFVGPRNVVPVWSMQPIGNHAVMTSIFLVGGVFSFVLLSLACPLANVIVLSSISGAAFGMMPFLVESLVERISSSFLPDASTRLDSLPFPVTSV